jgi:putative Ca2+/H+ antiporter (TMEM165/GDT1 family)
VLHKKIPEKLIKWFAALVFITFGLWGLNETLFNGLLKKSF